MMKIRILGSALQDLEEGRAFYERQAPGVGDYFQDCLFGDIDSLAIVVLGGSDAGRSEEGKRIADLYPGVPLIVTGDGGLIMGALRAAGLPEKRILHEEAADRGQGTGDRGQGTARRSIFFLGQPTTDNSSQSASSIQNCLWLCRSGLRQFFIVRQRSPLVQN